MDRTSSTIGTAIPAKTTIRDVRGSSGDDFIALAPDENDLESSITDVLIDHVVLRDADAGIRLLSRANGRLGGGYVWLLQADQRLCGALSGTALSFTGAKPDRSILNGLQEIS